jgi:colicin import membrane protein
VSLGCNFLTGAIINCIGICKLKAEDDAAKLEKRANAARRLKEHQEASMRKHEVQQTERKALAAKRSADRAAATKATAAKNYAEMLEKRKKEGSAAKAKFDAEQENISRKERAQKAQKARTEAAAAKKKKKADAMARRINDRQAYEAKKIKDQEEKTSYRHTMALTLALFTIAAVVVLMLGVFKYAKATKERAE